MDKSFERQYAINVARLKNGNHQDSFEIDSNFFQHFEKSLVSEGLVHALLDITKYETHLDVKFTFTGKISLNCDRCGEPYLHQLDAEQRIIYAFDSDMQFEGYEVMYVNKDEPQLVLVQEFYDFISLSIPLRKVPHPDVHICAPEVLELLGLNEKGEPLAKDEDETEIDPRWEKLRKLKDSES